MLENQRYSVRGFIIHNQNILLQEMTDQEGHLFVDGLGSFIEKSDNKLVMIQKAVNNHSKLSISQYRVKAFATVDYTIHKAESNNNKVEMTVFMINLNDSSVLFSLPWQWYKFQSIPYGLMDPDVELWLPKILANHHIKVQVEVKQNSKFSSSKIIKCSTTIVD